MALPDQPSGTAPPDVLRFGCPACRGELSIPAALAGVEGPCPLCGEHIAAPVPGQDQPGAGQSSEADIFSSVEDSLSPPVSPEPVPRESEAPPADLPGTADVYCDACGCELEIDPDLAHLPGGPCPRCDTWIDLQGRASTEPVGPAEESVAAPPPSRFPEERILGELSWGDVSGPTELNQRETAETAADFNFRRMESEPALESVEHEEAGRDLQEQRRVKKRVRRRQLPSEFYVGHAAAELDKKGRESADRMRRSRFPDTAGSSRRQRSGHGIRPWEWSSVRWLPVVIGIAVSVLGVLAAALYFDFIDPAELRFWQTKPIAESSMARGQLEEGIERTGEVMNGKAKEGYQAVENAIDRFFGAKTWEDAKENLSLVHVPANSEALAFLKMFPREAYRGATVKVIDFARIPRSERFVFTTHVSNGLDERGDVVLTFMVVEQGEDGRARVHALQLYQSWKRTLTEFLETSGAPGGRFYAAIRRVQSEPELTFPNDGPYIKLEIQDLLVKQPWVKEIYVRKESWAGTRLLTTLTDHWSKAVLDLEWLQGPTGDAFIHVTGLQSSTWGSFPK